MSADDKAAAAWNDYIDQQQQEKIEDLERQLSAASERIKRLEEAGDAVLKTHFCGCPYGESVFYCRTCVSAWDAWEEAKEAKP